WVPGSTGGHRSTDSTAGRTRPGNTALLAAARSSTQADWTPADSKHTAGPELAMRRRRPPPNPAIAEPLCSSEILVAFSMDILPRMTWADAAPYGTRTRQRDTRIREYSVQGSLWHPRGMPRWDLFPQNATLFRDVEKLQHGVYWYCIVKINLFHVR